MRRFLEYALAEARSAVKRRAAPTVVDLTPFAEETLKRHAEVFWAVREHRGEMKAGYWLKLLTPDRERWTALAWLASDPDEAREKIMELSEMVDPDVRWGLSTN